MKLPILPSWYVIRFCCFFGCNCRYFDLQNLITFACRVTNLLMQKKQPDWNVESREAFENVAQMLSHLDYSVLDKHRIILNQLALINNSYITVFDHYTCEHILACYGSNNILGIEVQLDENGDNVYFHPQIHPDDYEIVDKAGIAMINFANALPDKKMMFDYKLVNELRVMNAKGKYIRVVEQFQVLETDINGNLWLALSVMDISPDQQNETAMSQVVNFRNGELFSPPMLKNSMPNLSSRELEVLNMVKLGFYSREISDKLSISVNTVNTHRQNILTKLQASNSIEAVRYASKLGLI